MRIIDPESPETKTTTGDEPPAVVPRISADDLLSVVEQNRLTAERDFADQWLEVEGLVGTVQRAKAGGLVVYIPASIFGSVACYFTDGAFEDLAGLTRGDSVVIEGKVAAGRVGLTVRLLRCEIVQMSAAPDPDGPGGGGPRGKVMLLPRAA